jgi:hypothetical protein
MYPSGAGMPPQMFMQQQQQSNTPNHETTTGSGADQEEEGALAVGRQTKKQKQWGWFSVSYNINDRWINKQMCINVYIYG